MPSTSASVNKRKILSLCFTSYISYIRHTSHIIHISHYPTASRDAINRIRASKSNPVSLGGFETHR